MPYLIAITPRAGRWNHRYLVPPDLSLSTEVLGRLTRMASQQPQGQAWLAVSHEVQQVGGDRTGQEMLILGDLDVDSLTPEARERLQEFLRQRLHDLGELIAHGVEWEQEGRVDPVIRPELADWYAADFHPSGLLESRAPDWSLTSVISMKERKAIKEDKEEDEGKGIKEGKEKNESKRFWMIGSAVGVVGLLLGTVIQHGLDNTIFDGAVDNVVCEVTKISLSGKDSACILSPEDFKHLCDVFKKQAKECEKEHIVNPLREMKKIRDNFFFPRYTWTGSTNGGCFNGVTLLKEGDENAHVDTLAKELFDSDNPKVLFTDFDIFFTDFDKVLKYEKNIKDACKALNDLGDSNSLCHKGKPQTIQWGPGDYNIALLDIGNFLNKIPDTKTKPELSVLHDYFDWVCFIESKDKKIKSRLGCFKEEPPNGVKSWSSFKQTKGGEPSDYKFKVISLFETILKLKSEPLKSCQFLK